MQASSWLSSITEQPGLNCNGKRQCFAQGTQPRRTDANILCP